MRGVRNTESGIEVLDIEDPASEGERIEVIAAGICGSDLHLTALGPLPVTLGHEIAGRGPDGTLVAVEPLLRCGTCERCRRGDYQLCGRGQPLGVGVDGGMADALVVPPEAIVPLGAGVRPEDAALVEPLAVAVHGLHQAGFTPGQRIAVVGGGSIGLCAAAVAAGAAAEVGIVARHDHQRAAAEQLGATPAEGIYDLVVEAAGTESALAAAMDLAAAGATIVLLGTYWDGLRGPGFPITTKELRLVGSFGYCRHGGGRDADAAAALLATRPEIAGALITHRFPLEDAAEAFRVAADREAGAIKVTLHP